MDKDEFIGELKMALEAKWTHQRQCPLCKNKKWIPGDNILVIHPYTDPIAIAGGPYYPIVPITCSNCGYTIFINAKILGLSAPKEEGEAPSCDDEAQEADASEDEE